MGIKLSRPTAMLSGIRSEAFSYDYSSGPHDVLAYIGHMVESLVYQRPEHAAIHPFFPDLSVCKKHCRTCVNLFEGIWDYGSSGCPYCNWFVCRACCYTGQTANQTKDCLRFATNMSSVCSKRGCEAISELQTNAAPLGGHSHVINSKESY